MYMGDLPTMSGTQLWDPYHIASDEKRIVVIGSQPSTLFGSIADFQPVATKPVLGITHTTWTSDKPRMGDWEEKGIKLSIALGMARLNITPAILKEGIQLDPKEDAEKQKLKNIANNIGLESFLTLQVDNLPIYGAFRRGERRLSFKKKDVKKMLISSMKQGHDLQVGEITHRTPEKVLDNTSEFVKELCKKDYIVDNSNLDLTSSGRHYVEEKLLHTSKEAALMKIADASMLGLVRAEFRTFEERLSGGG